MSTRVSMSVNKPSVGSSPTKKRKGTPDIPSNGIPTVYASYPQHYTQPPYGSQPPQHPYASPYAPQHPPPQPYPQSAYGGGAQSQSGGYVSNQPPSYMQPSPQGAPPSQQPSGYRVGGSIPNASSERQPHQQGGQPPQWVNPADAYANSNASHPAPNSRSPNHATRNPSSPPPTNPNGTGGWHGQQYQQQQHPRSQQPPQQPSRQQQQHQHTPPPPNQQQNQSPSTQGSQQSQRPGYSHPPTQVWNTSSSPSNMEWGADGSLGGSTPPTSRASPNSGRNSGGMMSRGSGGSPNEGSMSGMMICEDVGPGGMDMAAQREKEMSDREKGRGSYRCGKCGAPKKGHVCPYQPKFKRRPDEPAPETRNATTQVEMDEFLVLRRLNLEIQGFPESYTSDPANNVGAESHIRGNHAVPRTVVGGPSPLSLNVGGGRVVPGMPPGHGLIPPVRTQINHRGLGPGAVSPLEGQIPGMPHPNGGMGMGRRPSPSSGTSRLHSSDGKDGIGRMGNSALPPEDVTSSSNSVKNSTTESDGSRVDRGT